MTRIGFCTTCKGRVQHIKQTLSQNLRDNADYHNCFFVLIDYGSPDDLVSYITENYQEEMACGKLYFYSLQDAGVFKMAHAKNVAHRLAMDLGAEVLVNLDADNYTGPGFARYIHKNLKRHQFMWSRMIQKCGIENCILPKHHEDRHSTNTNVLFGLYDHNERPRVRGISGRIVMHREAFMKTGGYDEKYANWGPDDKDMSLRLKMLDYEPIEIPSRFLNAVHHGQKLRFKEYPEAEDAANCCDVPILEHPHSAVVNFGMIGLGILLNQYTQEYCEINPLPTRVFGIGLHKTATTSLSTALNILGYKTGHWITPRWAREIWREMNRHGKSITLEKHEALTDLPVSIMFKELDKAYPNSKFILTVRDEVDWLRSVRDHWGDKNKWRRDWDNDCFSHRMHQAVYGRKSFDALVFLERYRRHNAEVIEYFKDRPNDLFIMDNTNWLGLCEFLDQDIPDLQYPIENQT